MIDETRVEKMYRGSEKTPTAGDAMMAGARRRWCREFEKNTIIARRRIRREYDTIRYGLRFDSGFFFRFFF